MSRRVIRCLGILLSVIVALVLAGALLPLLGIRTEGPCRKSGVQSVEGSLITALKAYRVDYGHFPKVRPDGKYETAEDNAKLMLVLRGLDATDNTHKTVYFEDRPVKQPSHPCNGFDAKGTLWDPWGNFYRIRVDADGDGNVVSPYKDRNGSILMTDVIVWSLGEDGVQSESDDIRDLWGNLPDDKLSWQ